MSYLHTPVLLAEILNGHADWINRLFRRRPHFPFLPGRLCWVIPLRLGTTPTTGFIPPRRGWVVALGHVTSKLGQPMEESFRQYDEVGASNHELEGSCRHADQPPLCKQHGRKDV